MEGGRRGGGEGGDEGGRGGDTRAWTFMVLKGCHIQE